MWANLTKDKGGGGGKGDGAKKFKLGPDVEMLQLKESEETALRLGALNSVATRKMAGGLQKTVLMQKDAVVAKVVMEQPSRFRI